MLEEASTAGRRREHGTVSGFGRGGKMHGAGFYCGCRLELRKEMRTVKGPAIFLAQFAGDAAPFNSLKSIGGWAAKLGYKGVQIPSWDARLFDLKRAAESKTYCEEIRGTLAGFGLEITELSTHLQGPCTQPMTWRSTDSRRRK
jgi:hypothetical protein